MKRLVVWAVVALATAFGSLASADPLPVDKRIVLLVDESKAVP